MLYRLLTVTPARRHYVATLWLLILSHSHAISIRHDVDRDLYVTLADTAVGRSVGALVSANRQFCTGTLVGPNVVLTAAHCFQPYTENAIEFVLGPDITSGSSVTVDKIVMHPFSSFYDANDLAIAYLADAISSTWVGISFDIDIGVLGTFVGYGYEVTSDGTVITSGTRLAAQNHIDKLRRSWVETDFDSPSGTTNTYGSANPTGLEGSTSIGDSGAPLFVGDNLVAVLWGGYNPYGAASAYGDISQWTLVGAAANAEFVTAHAVAPIPEPKTTMILALGLISITLRRTLYRD